MKDYFIKIPLWIWEPIEDKTVEVSMDKIMVYCYLYQNQSLKGTSFFMYTDYLNEIGRVNGSKKDYYLRKTKEILSRFEDVGIIKKINSVPGCIKYKLSPQQFSGADSKYIQLSYSEYESIIKWADTSYKAYLLSTLCLIKHLIYGRRGKDLNQVEFPIGVCSYSMEKLASRLNKDERTVRKYIKTLEELGLIARKVIRTKAKDGRFNVFTLHIPTSEANYQTKLDNAEQFIKEKFSDLKTKKF